MRLTELRHEGFRNLTDGAVRLAPDTTVLLGDNGQGKTNVLEAMGVLATSRSFRRAAPAEMARHGTASWRLAGSVEADGSRIELALAHEAGRRAPSVGGAPVELAEYIAHLTVVPVTQAHAGIVRGGPRDRRDFLDRGILGVRPAYLRTLASYRRIARHLSTLLRAGDAATGRTDPHVAAWLDHLAAEGAEVIARRRWYLERLRAALREVGPAFLPSSETLELSVQDALPSAPADAGRERLAELLGERLSATLPRSFAQGQVVVGPHRDELDLTLSGRDLRRFASSGQQRNALLALELAQVEVFRRERGESPVLLVDDVDTEIDASRLARFLEHVGGRAQAVLTSSKKDLFRVVGPDVVTYRVAGGVLTGP